MDMELVKLAFKSTLIILIIIPLIGFIQNKIILGLYTIISLLLGTKMAKFILTYVTFIGVCLHELSHAIMIWITGGKVTKIVFFNPEPDGTLGYVSWQAQGGFIARALQSTLSSVAPTVLGLVLITVLHMKALPLATETWQVVLIWYVMISMAIHLDMSSADIKGYIEGLPICLIIIFIICYFTKFDAWNHIQTVLAKFKH